MVMWAVVAVHGVGSSWFTGCCCWAFAAIRGGGRSCGLVIVGHPGCSYVVLLAVCWWCFTVVATLTVKDDFVLRRLVATSLSATWHLDFE
jgi:hypothetical protein